MDKQYLETEFNTFFEFDSDDRSVVTSTSAKMFAEHMAAPIEAQVEQLRAEMSVLRDAVRPFVRLMKDTSGRIPTERLAFSDWHALAKVGGDDTATEMPNVQSQRDAQALLRGSAGLPGSTPDTNEERTKA